MTEKITPDVYVVRADGNFIAVMCNSAVFVKKLCLLGYILTDGYYCKNTIDNEIKAKEMAALRDQDIPFMFGKEWSPTEVFEYFRDIGLLSGKFLSVYWTSPLEFLIEIK